MQEKIIKILKSLISEEKLNDFNLFISSNYTTYKPLIKNYLPKVKILTSENTANHSMNEFVCMVDLSSIKLHQSITNLNFKKLLLSTYPKDYLIELNTISRMLSAESIVKFISPGPICNIKNVRKTLKSLKFKDIVIHNQHLVSAKKRPLIEYSFSNNKYLLKETNNISEINKTILFAKNLFKDYDFSFEIEKMFSYYSDFFVCFDKSNNETLNFARYTWHIPNHYLPCMLAKKRNSEHLKLDRPETRIYGETFSPYKHSLQGLKVYKELTKTLLNHCLRINTDVFTTYNKNDAKAGEFFVRKFGFKDTGIILTYGSFGSEWGLLYGSKEIVPKIISENFLNS